jgi:hypothetical protein
MRFSRQRFLAEFQAAVDDAIAEKPRAVAS